MSVEANCEDCWYWEYDEETDECYCMMEFDEDEYARIFSTGKPCPYFRQSDDYYLSRRQ